MNDLEVTMQALTIRSALPHDGEVLGRLAELDSSRPLHGPVLVGEVGGEIWAAVSLTSYRVVSDPFRPSGELALLLVERARQLRRGGHRRGRLARAFASVSGDGRARPAVGLVQQRRRPAPIA
jgi:hypothetical protein